MLSIKSKTGFCECGKLHHDGAIYYHDSTRFICSCGHSHHTEHCLICGFKENYKEYVIGSLHEDELNYFSKSGYQESQYYVSKEPKCKSCDCSKCVYRMEKCDKCLCEGCKNEENNYLHLIQNLLFSITILFFIPLIICLLSTIAYFSISNSVDLILCLVSCIIYILLLSSICICYVFDKIRKC